MQQSQQGGGLIRFSFPPPDNERLLADFGAPFITAWKITHSFRVWSSNKHVAMSTITPG